jgi:dolichyl-phosphate beta-glucosyltransferase
MPVAGPELSVIVPAYNEEKRLPVTLEALACCFAPRRASVEVIVVNDGSRDATPDIARGASSQFLCNGVAYRVLDHATNMGKGAAIRTGALAAEGSVVLFTDADLAAPVSEFASLETAVQGGADIAIGVRQKSQRTVARRAMASVFGKYVEIMLGLPRGIDTQCGLKAFSLRAARRLFSQLDCRGYAFDVEILARAAKLGYRMVTIPVKWSERPGSKVSVLRDSLKMAVQVAHIRRVLRDEGPHA